MAQTPVRLEGIVIGEEGSVLFNASVNFQPGGMVVKTNEKGQFSVTLQREKIYLIEASYPGFNPHTDSLQLFSDTLLEIILYPVVNYLGEVLIVNNLGSSRRQSEPISHEVVNSSYIKSNLGGSLGHSLERLPGFTTIGIGSSQSKPVLRGLGHSRIAVTENGIKHQGQQWGTDHGLEIDQYAVGRVEVVRGPASLKYGSDAIGGLVDVRHDYAPIGNQSGGSIESTATSGNSLLGTSVQFFTRRESIYFRGRATFSTYADFKVPVDSINIYSYKVALHQNRVRNTAGNDLHFHLAAGYLGKRFSSRWYVSRYSARAGFFANAHGLEPRRVDFALHDASVRDLQFPYHDIEHFKAMGRNEWIFPAARYEITLGYQRNQREELGRYVQHGYMPASYPGENPELEKRFDKSTYTLHLTAEVFERNSLSWVTGIQSEYQDNSIGGTAFIIPSFRNFEAGGYSIAKWSTGRNTYLQGGLRIDRSFLDTDGYQDWFLSPLFTSSDTTYQHLIRSQPLQRNFTSLSYGLGLNHNPGDWNIRVNLGKSFRVPIAKELAANGVNYHHFSYEIGDPDLKPEVSYQLDAGIRYSPKGITIDITPFINYFSNYIYLNPTPYFDRLYGFGNQIHEYRQSQVFRYGSELTMDIAWYKWLSTSLSADYLFSQQLSGDKKGFTLPFSPPPGALFSVQLMPPSPRRIGELYWRTDLLLAATQKNIVPPEEVTPGYSVINMAAGGRMDLGKQQVVLSMQVKNLLNQTYFNHTSYYRLINIPEPARNLIINLIWKF